MGTPLREVIEAIGGGARPGRTIRAVLPGVSSAFIDAAALDTPVSYEALAAIGSGLGSAGFVVFDDHGRPRRGRARASPRFLAVESCGQCTPCKQDGLRIAELLEATVRGESDDVQPRGAAPPHRAPSPTARAVRSRPNNRSLPQSLLDMFPTPCPPTPTPAYTDSQPRARRRARRHRRRRRRASTSGTREKQPDWTYDAVDSGKSPAARLGEHREQLELDE